MRTTGIADSGAGLDADDLAEVESAVMARLDKIERTQAEAALENEALRQAFDEVLCEIGQMCSYLASVTERLRANS